MPMSLSIPLPSGTCKAGGDWLTQGKDSKNPDHRNGGDSVTLAESPLDDTLREKLIYKNYCFNRMEKSETESSLEKALAR